MTLQEAIKSGRPFRRPDFCFWMITRDGVVYTEQGELMQFGFTIDDLTVRDILANDWYIKEETVTITKIQLDAAFILASERDRQEDLWKHLMEMCK